MGGYGTAAPPPPPSGGGMDATTISVGLPDGCLVGFDRLRNELILNGKTSTMRLPHGSIPARPVLSGGGGGAIPQGTVIAEEAAVAMSKTGNLTKLGWKKNFLGSESWQTRHMVLTPTSLSYHKSSGSPALGTIALSKGLKVKVANASTPARKDRFEDGDNPGVGGMLTMNVGDMMSQTSGPLGRDNCVEVIVPVQAGTMLDSVTNQSVAGLAMGGGIKAMNAAKGRTYYLQASSAMEAQEWANALENNIKALPKDSDLTGGQPIGGAGGFAGLNNLVANATAMQEGMANAKDPTKSLGWYKDSLGTQLSLNELYGHLKRFYDQLDAAGVYHP